jgi:hypothetical protein
MMEEASLAENKKTYDAQRPAAGKKRGDIFAAWHSMAHQSSSACFELSLYVWTTKIN